MVPAQNKLRASFLFLVLAACAQEKEVAHEDAPVGDAQEESALHDYMYEEVQPVADIIWDNAGWVITEQGEQELFPTTDTGWQEVVRGAESLEAIAEELNSPEFAEEERSWEISTGNLLKSARKAKQAAIDQDKQRLFDAGGEVYRACLACHLRFARMEDEAGE